MPDSILLVCHDPPSASALIAPLQRRGYQVHPAFSADEALRHLRQHHLVSLALLALPLPGIDLPTFGEALREQGVPFLILGTDASLRGAEAFELGAVDHIVDPHADGSELLASIGMALGSRRGDVHLRYLRDKSATSTGWGSVVGKSPALLKIVGTLRQVGLRTSTGATPTILLAGETGTGKGFFARCIHDNSARRNQPFVDVNCAALPPGLIEAELFGHERGSFTDARAARAGLFETADRGTLFLDEIAAVPLDLQAKLLTALEEKRVRRIGARQSVPINVQVIAATHEDLPSNVRAGKFREDLFHRLNVIAVTVPALRHRKEDIVPLAEGFLRHFCHEYGMELRRLTDEAIAWMLTYRWPGNVRELRNQMERIVLLQNDAWVRAEHFQGPGPSAPPPSTPLPSTRIPALPLPTLPSASAPLSSPVPTPTAASLAPTPPVPAVRVPQSAGLAATSPPSIPSAVSAPAVSVPPVSAPPVSAPPVSGARSSQAVAPPSAAVSSPLPPPPTSSSSGPVVDIALEGGELRVSLPPSGVPLELLEREVLRQALERCDGNVSRAARFLSISRQTLIYRIKKFQLRLPSSRPSDPDGNDGAGDEV